MEAILGWSVSWIFRVQWCVQVLERSTTTRNKVFNRNMASIKWRFLVNQGCLLWSIWRSPSLQYLKWVTYSHNSWSYKFQYLNLSNPPKVPRYLWYSLVMAILQQSGGSTFNQLPRQVLPQLNIPSPSWKILKTSFTGTENGPRVDHKRNRKGNWENFSIRDWIQDEYKHHQLKYTQLALQLD